MTEEDVHNGLTGDEPIDQLLQAWFVEYATETKVGLKGTPFVVIPSRNIMAALEGLADTLIKDGHTYKDLYSSVLRLKIGNLIWKHKKIVNMTAQAIKNAKENLDDDWKQTIAKYSGIKIAKVESRVVETQKEYIPIPSTDGAGVIKSDPSKCAPIVVDDDFLSLFPDAIENEK